MSAFVGLRKSDKEFADMALKRGLLTSSELLVLCSFSREHQISLDQAVRHYVQAGLISPSILETPGPSAENQRATVVIRNREIQKSAEVQPTQDVNQLIDAILGECLQNQGALDGRRLQWAFRTARNNQERLASTLIQAKFISPSRVRQAFQGIHSSRVFCSNGHGSAVKNFQTPASCPHCHTPWYQDPLNNQSHSKAPMQSKT